MLLFGQIQFFCEVKIVNLQEENRVEDEEDITRSKRNKRRREKYNSLANEERNEHNKQRRIHYNTLTNEQWKKKTSS